MLQHLPADVACDRHDGLLACLSLGQLGDAGVPEVVKTKARERAFDLADVGLAVHISARHGGGLQLFASWAVNCAGDAAPGCAPRFDRTRSVDLRCVRAVCIDSGVLASWENIIFGVSLCEPASPLHQCRIRGSIQGNQSSASTSEARPARQFIIGRPALGFVEPDSGQSYICGWTQRVAHPRCSGHNTERFSKRVIIRSVE